jgi:hypothetical protein
MSKRASSAASWWLADHQLLCPGRQVGGVPRQGLGSSPSVPGRPEGPALQLQHSGQLDLQAPSSTHRHTHAQTQERPRQWHNKGASSTRAQAAGPPPIPVPGPMSKGVEPSRTPQWRATWQGKDLNLVTNHAHTRQA